MTQSLSTVCDTATTIFLNVGGIRLSDEQFYRLCADNPELRLELTADSRLIVMPPAFSGTGWKELEVGHRLAGWAEQDGTGTAFGPNAGFTLPNGAKRAPDASWIPHSRWNRLTWKQQNREFAPICPDFVVELRSASDHMPEIEAKMTEYIENGARLGWLLDPIAGCVTIYRTGRRPERLRNPGVLDGEDVLPGFQFHFQAIVEPPEPPTDEGS